MTGATARVNSRVTIADVARKALGDANGNIDEAARMFEAAIRQSRSLRDQLTEPLIADACRVAVRKEVKDVRREVWTGSQSRAAGQSKPDAIKAQAGRVVQLAAGTLAMFPLPGGKRLGEASREEISTAAEFYGRQAADMGAKARWLRLIAQSVPDGKKVSDVLSDARLRELQAEASRADV